MTTYSIFGGISLYSPIFRDDIAMYHLFIISTLLLYEINITHIIFSRNKKVFRLFYTVENFCMFVENGCAYNVYLYSRLGVSCGKDAQTANASWRAYTKKLVILKNFV